MKTRKVKLNELQNKGKLNTITLTDDQMSKLRKIIVDAYQDIQDVCEKNGINVFLYAGSLLGAIRHQGFIPWDDDFDVAMFRGDYERFKECFDRELGDKYELNAPNYSKYPSNRFPKVLVKGTRFVELGMDKNAEFAKIKFDIFIYENIPTNKLVYTFKKASCNMLMGITSLVGAYERYLRKKRERKKGKLSFRAFAGFIFSFKSVYEWRNAVDKAIQYGKDTGFVGAVTGNKHYSCKFGPKSMYVPTKKQPFENRMFNVPNDPIAYLQRAFGSDYMQLPPVEKRERHFIVDIDFGDLL